MSRPHTGRELKRGDVPDRPAAQQAGDERVQVAGIEVKPVVGAREPGDGKVGGAQSMLGRRSRRDRVERRRPAHHCKRSCNDSIRSGVRK